MERTLSRGKAVFESQREVDQVPTYEEGSSSGTHDEDSPDPPMEEVASQDIDHQVYQHADDGANLNSVDLNLGAPDLALSVPAHI
uniref:Uncharacterized protein n=1 Tax=Cannabis sativa TaxID=3483 RepID=A0A803QQX0_CANSA